MPFVVFHSFAFFHECPVKIKNTTSLWYVSDESASGRVSGRHTTMGERTLIPLLTMNLQPVYKITSLIRLLLYIFINIPFLLYYIYFPETVFSLCLAHRDVHIEIKLRGMLRWTVSLSFPLFFPPSLIPCPLSLSISISLFLFLCLPLLSLFPFFFLSFYLLLLLILLFLISCSIDLPTLLFLPQKWIWPLDLISEGTRHGSNYIKRKKEEKKTQKKNKKSVSKVYRNQDILT